MKKIYNSPTTSAQAIRISGIICASGGDRISSNLDIHGGDNSGDVTGAF